MDASINRKRKERNTTTEYDVNAGILKKERKKERQLADFLTSLEQAGYTAKAVACCWAGAVMQTFGLNIENVEKINRGTNGPTG